MKNVIPLNRQEKFLQKTGQKALEAGEELLSWLDFIGDIAVSFTRVITGKSYFRWNAFFVIVKRCGVDPLILVSLISLLVGVILAFVASIQLKIFGAQIFVAQIEPVPNNTIHSSAI